MTGTLVEKREQLTEKQKKLGAIFEEAGSDLDFSKVTLLGEGDTAMKVKKVQEMNDELTVLADEITKLHMQQVSDQQKQRDLQMKSVDRLILPDQKPTGTMGELFADSTPYKRYLEKKSQESFSVVLPLELKTLFATTAGWPPRPPRIDLVVPIAERPVQLLQIIPTTSFDQPSVIYMEETTATHAGVELAEAGTYPESTYVLTERTSTVRKIADSVPVTDEQLADVSQVRDYLDQRLRFGLMQRLDQQVLTGSGTGVNLQGIKTVSGIQTQAKGTDPAFDAILKAITLSRVTGRAFPNAIAIHPTDWQNVKLTRTADGIYILGNPSEPGPNTLWGLPVVLTDADSAGTAYIGDFANFCRLYERKGVEVQVGFTGTQFTEGKSTLRADTRVAFVITRGAAFVKVTGL